MPRRPCLRATATLLPITVAAALLAASPARAVSLDVVISEVYGAGGNTGASYSSDFVELRNTSGTDVDVDGWSVQYASATGTSWQVTPLSGTVPAGGYFLVQEATGTAPSTPLPPPDSAGDIAMSGTNGQVALVTTAIALDCGADCAGAATVRDFVGYGTADDFEGTAAAPALTVSTSAQRDEAGTDTDQNGTDLTAAAPTPTNSGIEPEPVAIHDIQGAAHLSPLDGQSVSGVSGVVTRASSSGFWMQDPAPDADPGTSEGVLVFTTTAPPAGVVVGASVTVSGVVDEFRRGGSTSTNLTTTEITSPTVQVHGMAAVPETVLVGPGGREPPLSVIDDDASGSVETSGSFDAQTDGIDFYESMEGMRVALDSPQAVGPTNSFGELTVVTQGAGLRTPRGGIVVRPGDFNPERVILDTLSGPSLPAANVGDTVAGLVSGVLDYDFGNFHLYVDQVPTLVPADLTRETAAPAGADELSVATYNVENLSPADDPVKFEELAAGIVERLGSPDVVALEEVQDNTGPVDDGVVAADETLDQLVEAIATAGGPAYDWRSIDPEDGEEGGQPGGNIRVAFLFRTDRGLQFVDRTGGDATTAVEVVGTAAATHLSASPGRVEPENRAWVDSRKPLAGEFTWQNRTVFVVANHFASKGGDEPLFGRFQPPNRSSEVQRHRQATVLRGFVDELLVADPDARVVLAGDLNDFQFSQTLDILAGAGGTALLDLPLTLPARQRYTYVFDGNAQVLDHILVSPRLVTDGFDYDVVHTNAEFADQVSDHDPQVAHLAVDPPDPTSLTIGANLPAIDFGAGMTLTGELTGSNDMGGQTIRVQARPVGAERWRTVALARTGSLESTWAADVEPLATTRYRAVYAGGEDLPSRSGTLTLGVRPRVSAQPSDRSVDLGDRVQVAGVVAPGRAVDRVLLQRWVDGSWRVVAGAAVGPRGGYAVRWPARPPGLVVLRVAAPETSPRYLAGFSRRIRIQVG